MIGVDNITCDDPIAGKELVDKLRKPPKVQDVQLLVSENLMADNVSASYVTVNNTSVL